MTALFLPEAGCTGGGSARKPMDAVTELIPGQKEANLRKRVEADSFPTAEKAGIQ
jgi:hypothetical protein